MRISARALWNGVRALALRPPRGNPIDVGPGTFVVLIVAYFVAQAAIGIATTGRPWAIAPNGVTTLLADALLTLVAAWTIARLLERDGVFWSIASTLLAATIAVSVIVQTPVGWLANRVLLEGHVIAAVLLDLVARAWWLFVVIGVTHALAPRRTGRALAAALIAYAISAATWWWLPASDLVRTADTETPAPADAADGNSDADAGDVADAEVPASAAPDFDAEYVMYDQRRLVDEAAAALRPETPGTVDLYVVAFAGDGSEDVFRNEAEFADKLFEQRFGAQGRVIVLENSTATVATRPLATLTNLTLALDAVAKTMNPAEDILLVYLTTHGSRDHELLVDLDPLPLDQIAPDDLADALKTRPGVRWKVVVVNACYSGGFIDAIRDDSTMVITSAREDRTSFGCGSDSDITYFGKAFLADALNRTTSMPEAFALARKSVAEWEDRDQEEHSEPQIATTRSIEAKLAGFERTLKPAPVVPFAPAESAK
ncbi:MAG TPA: C13 family peptidase [Rhodanobacteraceae bacterium]|nr:C13 family peptidase [Rhodanobacteraceae bacterium]